MILTVITMLLSKSPNILLTNHQLNKLTKQNKTKQNTHEKKTKKKTKTKNNEAFLPSSYL